MDDSELRTNLGQQGKQYQQQYYNWTEIMEKYETMISAVAP